MTTTRDPDLPHQVIIYQHRGKLSVSCNCRWIIRRQPGFPENTPIGVADTLELVYAAYNDAANHDTEVHPFTVDLHLTGRRTS